MEGLDLKDVIIQEKVEGGRLKAYMTGITLEELDLSKAVINFEITSKTHQFEQGSNCEDPFEITVHISNAALTLRFNQIFELESNDIVDERDVGRYIISDFTFDTTMQPFVYQEKFRLHLLESNLRQNDFQYQIRIPEDSRFTKIFENYAGLFAEHLKQKMQAQLTTALTDAIQEGVYSIFRKFQIVQNYSLFDNLFLNKHIRNICFVPSRRRDTTKRLHGALGFEIDGQFQRIMGAINPAAELEGQAANLLTGQKLTNEKANLNIKIGRVSIDSLLKAIFVDGGIPIMFAEEIEMTTDEADEYIDGFTNTFGEDKPVKISLMLEKFYDFDFDEQFNNVPFKADVSLIFSNPLSEEYIAATCQLTFKGILDISLSNDMSIQINLKQEDAVMTDMQTYFFSETELDDFQEKYFDELHESVLEQVEKAAEDGLMFPLGWDAPITTTGMKINIFKNYVNLEVAETKFREDAIEALEINTYSSVNHDEQRKISVNYPLMYQVDSQHNLTKFFEGEKVGQPVKARKPAEIST